MTEIATQNAFWALPLTDVYHAISWDRLHAYHGGLFRKHILKEFLLLLEDPATGTGQVRRTLGSEFETQSVWSESGRSSLDSFLWLYLYSMRNMPPVL